MSADTPDPYVPPMTPGRVLYERWLGAQDISPDDLWDHLDQHEQFAWEALSGGSGEVPAPGTREERALERLDEALMGCADVGLTGEQIVGHVLEHVEHHA